MFSSKLRLARSQSMGVTGGGMGLGGGLGMASSNSSKTSQVADEGGPAPSGTESAAGRVASVILLDERRLEVMVQPRMYAGELLDLVTAHCHLREKEFFGLAVMDENGHYQWLQLDRKVLDHDLPRKTLNVHFLVKFFIESIAHLSENRTVELFYLQARNLIFRGSLEVESDIVFQLAALALQASHGDPVENDQTTRSLIKKSPVLPASVLKEHPSLTYCEDQVIQHYKKTRHQTRGQAIVNYMTIVESMPTYGVHYFEVYDKRQTPWWLGLSCRGIAQYNYHDRKVPVRVFQWKQLENLYFRDKKFSIEVHDEKRVVQTVTGGGPTLYDDALQLGGTIGEEQQDSSAAATAGAVAGSSPPTAQDGALVEAISDSTTQVSVSRRSFNQGSIHVYVWFGKTQTLTKCIWQSAISQHQFYLDRKQARMRHAPQRTLKDIARDLTRSSVSLSSTTSSASNLSRSVSSNSLAVSGCLTVEEQQLQSEETKRARMEMIAALKARREALDSKLKDKQKLLRDLCIKEAELTGELPPEMPLFPGEPPPTIRRRVKTEFALPENLFFKVVQESPEEEQLSKLELEFELQTKITSAALKIASDTSAPKSVRKHRKASYEQSQKKLNEIEAKLASLRKHSQQQRGRSARHHPPAGLLLNPPVNHPGRPQPPSTTVVRGSSEERLNAKARNYLDAARSRAESTVNGRRALPRRGLSVPELDVSSSSAQDMKAFEDGENEGEDDDDDEGDDEASGRVLSPKSCPSSPRKVNHHHPLPSEAVLMSQTHHRLDALLYQREKPSLSSSSSSRHVDVSPNRKLLNASPGRAGSGHCSSSSQSRVGGQLPAAGVAGNLHDVGLPLVGYTLVGGNSSSTRSATLPSPFRSKYEVPNINVDSPVGLYNCPQQRTSQAFSSMDDLDALAAAAPPGRAVAHASPHHRPPVHGMTTPTSALSPSVASPVKSPHHNSYVNHHLMNHRHILSQAQAVISHVDAATAAAMRTQSRSNSISSFSAKGAGTVVVDKSSATSRAAAAESGSSLDDMEAVRLRKDADAVGSLSGVYRHQFNNHHPLGHHPQQLLSTHQLQLQQQHHQHHLQQQQRRRLYHSSIHSAASLHNHHHLHHHHHHHQHHHQLLQNTDEYPTDHHPSSPYDPERISETAAKAAAAAKAHQIAGLPSGFASMSAAAAAAAAASSAIESGISVLGRDAGGPYPASALSQHSSTLLLPGQTYPEPVALKQHHHPSLGTLQEVFYHRELRLAAAAKSGDKDASSSTVPPPLPPPSSSSKYSSSAGLEEGVVTSSSSLSESPPPLFPKQYHQVIEQRRRSGLDRPTATAVPPKPKVSDQSPAVDRKSKPGPNNGAGVPLSSPKSSANSTPLEMSPSKPVPTGTKSSGSSTLPSSESNGRVVAVGPGSGSKYLLPYKETTKPFEMSDFYKYSTKFRKTSSSSLQGGGGGSNNNNQQESSDTSSQRSSTASVGSAGSPPELPAKPKGPSMSTASAEGPVPAAQTPPPPPPKGAAAANVIVSGDAHLNSLVGGGDSFSSEMFSWYNSRQGQAKPTKLAEDAAGSSNGNGNNNSQQAGKDQSEKPATLV